MYYFVDITVDVKGEERDETEIKAWLVQVFQNNLESCVSPNNESTTAPPTSTHTNETTLMTTATTIQSFNTTTATTVLTSNDTTTATIVLTSNNTTPASTSNTFNSNNTTPASTSTTLTSNNTTPVSTLTTLKSNNTSPVSTLTTLKSNNTSPVSTLTTLKSNNTTPVSTSTTFNSNNTTPASTLTTLKSNNTTPVSTSTTFNSNNTTPASTLTTLKSNNTNPVAISTTLQTVSTTAAATTTTLQPSSTTSLLDPSVTTQAPGGGGNVKPTKKPNPSGNKQRIAREIHGNVTEASGNSNGITTGLYQDMEVNCAMKTAIRNTNCTVMLKLRQSVPPCCILRTLCAASVTSSDIRVVGRKADRTSQLKTVCNSNPQEEKTCSYKGPTGGSCEVSGSAYVVQQSNSTHCGAGER
ncbi:A-agglutinin anchorage subunit-like isoform X2 [Sparus aurata]|uniref:A-agglutinin anchorage subunit-like isoform X2 n=1 Tax=Sparus aurata TaxID=8175 RepID=UPI0011C16A1B|nr:A-agglutinin anchorage subunit-like isoform X2 [Sparus aurata]